MDPVEVAQQVAQPTTYPRKHTVAEKPIIVRHNHQQQHHVPPEIPIYAMTSRPKGLFLCINNIDFVETNLKRNGAVEDESALKIIFYKLGYHVHSCQNQDAMSITTKIAQFSRRAELQVVDSVVIAVMSHGTGSKNMETMVVGTNNELVSCQSIVEQFNAANCPAMLNKPKIFLFQLCRGDQQDIVKPQRVISTESDGTAQSDTCRLNEDVFVAHATVPGFSAHRHTGQGSWFVQEVCRAYMQYACSMELQDMHNIVDGHLKNYKSDDCGKQTSCYENTGFKKFYFYPGKHEAQPSTAQ